MRPHVHRRQLEDEPGDARRGRRAGRGGQGGGRPGGRGPRGGLPAVRSTCNGSTRSWPARRSASAPRTCTGRPRAPTPAKSPGPCSTTSAAPTSSSATASGGTAWARPTTQVNRKLHAALAAGLLPIVCVGETREEREADRTEAVVGRAARRLAGRALARADGRGRARLRAGLGDRHRPDRHARAGPGGPRLHPQRLARAFGEATAARVVVQYGGSVKAGQRRRAARLPRHRRGPGRRGQPQGGRLPRHLPGRSGRHRLGKAVTRPDPPALGPTDVLRIT